MKFPDLNHYRSILISNGASYPLPLVPAPIGGLLAELPSVSQMEGWPWNEQTSPTIYHSHTNWPKLTIVVPSFNQGHYIEETIRSILLQNYPNLELVVIDGGSSDITLDILRQYSNWISYYRSEKDRGQSQAINMGFSIASGNYYAWINSDDYYLNGAFHLVMAKFRSSKSKFVYGYAIDYNQDTGVFTQIKVPPITDFFIKIPGLMQPSCFWDFTIHKAVWEELHCALDYELWIRMLKGNKRSRIKQALSVARTHYDAKSHHPDMKARWQQDHLKIWSEDGHGPVPEWNRIVFLNRIRMKLYMIFKVL